MAEITRAQCRIYRKLLLRVGRVKWMKGMVSGPTYLSLTAWRQYLKLVSKAITGSKSRGTSFGTTLCHRDRGTGELKKRRRRRRRQQQRHKRMISLVNYRLTHSASELSGFTCTSSLTMNEKFQYRTSFSFIVSELVQVNPDNSRAMSALTFLLFKLNTL